MSRKKTLAKWVRVVACRIGRLATRLHIGEKVKTPGEVWGRRPGSYTSGQWIRIDADDTVTVRVNHTEMGQGITTAMSMIVADEAEADWSKIRFEIAFAESVYKNPEYDTQNTVDSASVRSAYADLRKAGAVARETMIAAASKTWRVPVSECRAVKSTVVHETGGRALKYGELAGTAAKLPIPENVCLKNFEDFKLIGQSIPRFDVQDKTHGRIEYGIDMTLPGMLTAVVVHPPVFDSKAESYDPSAAMAVPGVRHVLPIKSGIAVVSDTFWQAQKGAGGLRVTWKKTAGADFDSDSLPRRWRDMSGRKGKIVYKTGNACAELRKSENTVRAVYDLPYQAHAVPEPINCLAHVREDGCDVWAPTQYQDAAQETAAGITGLKYEAITVHTPFVGGGFGRRVAVGYVAEAVTLSKALGVPVKVVWTREEDFKTDCFRPASCNIMEAVPDAEGMPVYWKHKIIGPDHMRRMMPTFVPSIAPYWIPRFLRDIARRLAIPVFGRLLLGDYASQGAHPLVYGVDNVRVSFVLDDPGISIGFWRSVGYSTNVFAVESFIDELAVLAGKDPYEYRRELLKGNTGMRSVLETVAEKAGWHEKPPEGRYRGIAAMDFHGAYLAYVAEVSVAEDGAIRVHRMVCAVDCGIVVNPEIVKAQIEGAVAFGLTAALKSAASFKNGKLEQTNFDKFPILRFDEMPEVRVRILASRRAPQGIGESGVPLVAPAVANAVFAATGIRIRHLPIGSTIISHKRSQKGNRKNGQDR